MAPPKKRSPSSVRPLSRARRFRAADPEGGPAQGSRRCSPPKAPAATTRSERGAVLVQLALREPPLDHFVIEKILAVRYPLARQGTVAHQIRRLRARRDQARCRARALARGPAPVPVERIREMLAREFTEILPGIDGQILAWVPDLPRTPPPKPPAAPARPPARAAATTAPRPPLGSPRTAHHPAVPPPQGPHTPQDPSCDPLFFVPGAPHLHIDLELLADPEYVNPYAAPCAAEQGGHNPPPRELPRPASPPLRRAPDPDQRRIMEELEAFTHDLDGIRYDLDLDLENNPPATGKS